MKIMCLSICNYITTNIKIPLVIKVIFSRILFLFKSQLLKKGFYSINIDGLIGIYLTPHHIRIWPEAIL